MQMGCASDVFVPEGPVLLVAMALPTTIGGWIKAIHASLATSKFSGPLYLQ